MNDRPSHESPATNRHFKAHRIETRSTSYRVLAFESPFPDRVPLVLLHGFLGAGVLWSRFAEFWSAERPVYAVDLPGHGGSNTRSASLDFSGLGQDLAALLHQIEAGRPAHLLGYSLGGRLAAAAVTLGRYRPASLILESAHPGLVTAAERRKRRPYEDDLLERLRHKPFEDFLEQWNNQPLLRSRQVHTGTTKQRLDVMKSQSPEAVAATFEAARLSAQPYLDEALRKLACPLTWVVGERDTTYTLLAHRAATTASQVVLIEDAGHTVHAEQPDTYRKLIHERCRFADGALTP